MQTDSVAGSRSLIGSRSNRAKGTVAPAAMPRTIAAMASVASDGAKARSRQAGRGSPNETRRNRPIRNAAAPKRSHAIEPPPAPIEEISTVA